MLAEAPLTTDDHLDVDSEGEYERGENGPVIGAEYIAVERAGQETCEDYERGDDTENEGGNGESI